MLRIVLALVVLALATPGFAQTAKQDAGRLFSEGNALYDKGDFAGALKKFESARARYPSYKIDLNIATVLVDLGRAAAAAETYEVFLQRGGALAPPDILASARAKLDELKTRLGRVSVTCPEAGATLKVDGKPSGTLPRDRPVYLQPGEHQFEACKQGFTCSSEAVTIAAGEKRELALSLRGEPAGDTDTATTATATTDTATTDTATTDTSSGSDTDQQPRGGWKGTAGWVTLGVGGASLVTGVIFGAMVSSTSDDHAQAIADGKTYGELLEIADTGRRYESVHIATLVIGGVAVAAGGGLLLWHYLGARRGSEARAAFVAPLLSSDVRGLVGGMRF